jgi:hypothetical protein
MSAQLYKLDNAPRTVKQPVTSNDVRDDMDPARGIIWAVLGSVLLIPILWVIAVAVIAVTQAVFGS